MSHNAGELAGLQDLEVPTAEMRDMFGMAWSGLEHYAQMLAEEGQLRGLIGPRELPRLYSRHLVNSAAVVPFLPTMCGCGGAGPKKCVSVSMW